MMASIGKIQNELHVCIASHLNTTGSVRCSTGNICCSGVNDWKILGEK